MDEAEKPSHKILVLARGKVIVEGAPQQIIAERVKKFALEIRQADAAVKAFPFSSSVVAQKRGTTQVYFADSVEQLTPIMNLFDAQSIFLRPSNLEDVFLQISHAKPSPRKMAQSENQNA